MEHKKMYKAKKRWLVASMIGVAGASMMASMDAHADTVDNGQASREDAIDNINQAATNLNQNSADLQDQEISASEASTVNSQASVQSSASTETMKGASDDVTLSKFVDHSTSAQTNLKQLMDELSEPSSASTDQLAESKATAKPATPNAATHIYNFVDEASGQTVSSQKVTGITDQTTPVHLTIPKGYHLSAGEEIPQEVVLKANTLTTNIKVAHNINTTTDEKTVTRTIEILNPLTNESSKQTQSHKFTRNKITDEVTGKVTYGAWSSNGQFVFDPIQVPVVPGYTPNMAQVGSMTVTPSSQDSTVKITYTVNDEGQVINLVDDQGNVIASQTITGKTGDVKSVNLSVPKGWILEQNQSVPQSITLNDGAEPINIRVMHATKNTAQNKTITRTIIVTNPDGKQNKIVQSADFVRKGVIDNVTGKTTWQPWESSSDQTSFPEYKVPDIAGYDPSQSVVSEETIDPNITLNHTVTVIYNAESMDQKIDYIDDTDGKLLDEDSFAGKAGTDHAVKLNIPKGYELVKGQNIPTSVHFTGQNMKPIAVHLQHIIDNIPVTSTVKRTITINNPDKTTKTEVQSVTFKRTDQKDEVNGYVVTGKWDKQSATLPEYTPAKIRGYEANPATVAALTVKPGDKDTTVTVNYKAIDYHEVLNLIDKTDGSTVIKKTLVGHIGDTIDLDLDSLIPENYMLAPYQENIPDSVTFDDHDLDPLTIYLVHRTKDETETKDITRTVKIHSPKTGEVNDTKVQHAKFTRTVTKDLVTNKTVNTGAWDHDSITLPSVNVDTYDEYSPKEDVDEWIVKPTDASRVVDVEYGPKVDKVTVNYVDSNGKTVKSVKMTGAPNSQGLITPEVPEGYKLVDGQDNLLNFTYGSVSEVDLLVEKEGATPAGQADTNSSTTDSDSSADNGSTANNSTDNVSNAGANNGSANNGLVNNGASNIGNGSASVANNSGSVSNTVYNTNATPDYSNMSEHQYAGAVASDIMNSLPGVTNAKADTTGDSGSGNGSSSNGNNDSSSGKLPQTANSPENVGAEAFGLGLLSAMTGAAGLGVARKREN